MLHGFHFAKLLLLEVAQMVERVNYKSEGWRIDPCLCL